MVQGQQELWQVSNMEEKMPDGLHGQQGKCEYFKYWMGVEVLPLREKW